MLGELLQLQAVPAPLAAAILGLFHSKAAAQGSRVSAQGGSPDPAPERPQLRLPAEAQPLVSLAWAAQRVLQDHSHCRGPSQGSASRGAAGSLKRRSAEDAADGKPYVGPGGGAGPVPEGSAGDRSLTKKRRKSAAGGRTAAAAAGHEAAVGQGAADMGANAVDSDAGCKSGRDSGPGVAVHVKDSSRSAARLRKLLRRVLEAMAPDARRSCSQEAVAHADGKRAAVPARGRGAGAAMPAAGGPCAASADGHDLEAAASADQDLAGADLLPALLRAPSHALATELPGAAAACWTLAGGGERSQPCPDSYPHSALGLHEPGRAAAAVRAGPGDSAFAPLFWACRAHGVSPCVPVADAGDRKPDPKRAAALAAALDACPFMLLLRGCAAHPGVTPGHGPACCSTCSGRSRMGWSLGTHLSPSMHMAMLMLCFSWLLQVHAKLY